MLNQLAASDLRALKVFKVVAEVGSFSAAQSYLNVNESTISSQISGFEKRLGFLLCTRGRSGFQLTKRGKVVLDEYRKLDVQLDVFRQTLNTLEDKAIGSLRVGTLEQTITETQFSIINLFDQFINEAPWVNLYLVQNIQSELYQAVLDEQLDVAVGSFNIGNSLIKSEHLYTEQQYIYCGVKHPFCSLPAEKITQEDLKAVKWVSRGYTLDDFSHLPINTKQVTATAASLEAVTAIILAGHHIGYLPEHFAKRFEKSGQLKRLLADELRATLHFSMITKCNRHETMALKVFREIALAMAK